jgi:hypothetical protein
MSPYSSSVLSSLVLPSSITMNRAAPHLEGAPLERTSEGHGDEREADPLDHDREVIGKTQPPPSSPAPTPGRRPEGAPKEGITPPPPKPSRFPDLTAAFAHDARLLRRIDLASFDELQDAAKALAMKGPGAAAAVLDREGKERR